MRRADKLNARYVLILGENELTVGKGTVRDMQAKADRPTAVELTLPAQAMMESIRNTSSQPSALSSQPESTGRSSKPAFSS
jgi:histidyl-tRNA synthetase